VLSYETPLESLHGLFTALCSSTSIYVCVGTLLLVFTARLDADTR
jgi:hypothetical protein